MAHPWPPPTRCLSPTNISLNQGVQHTDINVIRPIGPLQAGYAKLLNFVMNWYFKYRGHRLDSSKKIGSSSKVQFPEKMEGVPKVQFFGTAGTAVPQFLSVVPMRSVK